MIEPTFTRHRDIYRQLADPNCPTCQGKGEMLYAPTKTWIDCFCLQRRRTREDGRARLARRDEVKEPPPTRESDSRPDQSSSSAPNGSS